MRRRPTAGEGGEGCAYLVEPDALRGENERDAAESIPPVPALVTAAARRREEAPGLVEAEGAGGDAAALGQLADGEGGHFPSIPLDLKFGLTPTVRQLTITTDQSSRVDAGLVTYHWHHARFDLASGCTLDPFADDARASDSAVEDGRVWVWTRHAPGAREALER